MNSFEQNLKEGKRFEFGENWKNFLSSLNDERILAAEDSLRKMLEINNLQGKTFLDIGSGSGLFSLAVRNCGGKVHSFDYDPKSVACAQYLKEKYYPDDNKWVIEKGDVLDKNYLKSLGKFDVVFSWGVLHHTGAMWDALNNVSELVNNGGKLFIAIYNDQGRISRYWKFIKKTYCASSKPIKFLILCLAWIRLRLVYYIFHLLKFKNPFKLHKKPERGMSLRHDLIDWVGGYPFEVARPEKIFDFYKNKGFILSKLTTTNGGHGCNQFVFYKSMPPI